jgi:hypothetical protein
MCEKSSVASIKANVMRWACLFGVSLILALPLECLGARSSIELQDLLTLYLVPETASYNMYDWALGADPGSPIQWTTKGIVEAPTAYSDLGSYIRKGTTVITSNGKPMYSQLERARVAGKWSVVLIGPRGGFTRVQIESNANSPELEPGLDQLKTKLALKQIRCFRGAATYGNAIYEVHVPGKKVAWLVEEWSGGASGENSLMLSLVFDKAETNTIRCIE